MVLLDNTKLQAFLIGITIIMVGKLSKVIGPIIGSVGWIFITWSLIIQHNMSIKINLKTIMTLLTVIMIVAPDHIENNVENKTCSKICGITKTIGWILFAYIISLKSNSLFPSLSNISKSKSIISIIALILLFIKLLTPISPCAKDILLINLLWLFALANGIPSTPGSSASVALSSI